MKKNISYSDKVSGGNFTSTDANEIKSVVNSNSDELFNKYKNYGSGIQKFLMKLRSDDTRYKEISIGVAGDSILGRWNISPDELVAYLTSLYPNKTFTKIQVKLGGTGSPYFMAGLWQLCNYSPDLVIIMEYEGWSENDYLNTMFRYLRKYSSSDIAVIPWSMHKTEMDKLSAGNISGFISGQDNTIMKVFLSMCSNYGAQMIDVRQPLIPKLISGEVVSTDVLVDDLHPNDAGIHLWVEEFDKHFSPIWDYEHLQYNGVEKFFNISFFREALEMPDVTDFVLSGTWDTNLVNNETIGIEKCLRTSDTGAYIEFYFEGIGFELHQYNGAIGQLGILIDDVAPSTFMKNVADQIYAANELEKMYKCIVNSNLLADSESSRLFYLKVQTVTRVDGEVTECTYKLIDITKGSIIVEENLNALADETIEYDGGSITIPAQYAGVQNLRSDSETPFAVDAIWQLYIRKHYSDSVTQTADGLRKITRFTGLERKKHKIRIIRQSGTINLESFMELK